MKKYVFRKYKFWYPKLFKKEKSKLIKLFPNARIEHVGSTSIPQLGGKGIIDVLLGLKKSNWKKAKEVLLNNKYTFMKNIVGDKDRISFMKDYCFWPFRRRVHIHVTYINSTNWKEKTNFRDNLLSSKKLCREYEKIKKEGVEKAKGDSLIYRAHKAKFIKKYSK
jgi:GrpB-like predicted nucleotidyltransferase (UPF0157 family)